MPLVSVLLPATILILLLQSVHQFGLPTLNMNFIPKNTTRTCGQCELATPFNASLSITRFNDALIYEGGHLASLSCSANKWNHRNYRTSSDPSLQEMENFYHKALSNVIHQQRPNITIQRFSNPTDKPKSLEWPDTAGKVTIVSKLALEPSPINPSHMSKDSGWLVLEGTMHHIPLNESPSKNVIVTPFLMGSNTDTKS
ncbi:hypothetical protein HDU81_007829 [Chytriomyces hyalinus]|nr:hypothetical protein HDU81_007829 [Chytriomyces hyalinus]